MIGSMLRIIVFIFIVFLSSACTGLPKVVSSDRGLNSASRSGVIYVVNHGWHTGLVVEADWLLQEMPALATRFADSRFIEVGWGDAGFYQSSEITLGLTIRAIFTPTDSVMHVVGLENSPYYEFTASEILAVSVSPLGYWRLLQFIRLSFDVNAEGKAISLKPGIYGDSQFYSGVGSYFLFNNCNTWTAKALSSAGLPIRVAMTLTAKGVMNAVQNSVTSND